MQARSLPLNAGHAKRLSELEAAFAAYRRSAPGRRISGELRGQAVAALAAGVPASAVLRVCRLSWSQLSRWRNAASSAEVGSGQARSAELGDAVRVLSVVDPVAGDSAMAGDEIEIRIGGWRVRFDRATD